MKTGTTTTEKAEPAPLVIRASHTPGPWVVSIGEIDARYLRGIGGVVLIRRNAPRDDRYVAMAGLDAMGSDYPVHTTTEERAANARLIAAAPELLEAAQDFVAKVERGEARSTKSYAAFKTAIAKATGEQSTVEKFESDLSAIKEAIR